MITQPSNELQTLLDAGVALYASGDTQAAHDRWREAAIIDPYHERVWLLLLQVLESDEDRRVCLENIIAINPQNVEARRQLRAVRRALREAHETEFANSPASKSVFAKVRQRRKTQSRPPRPPSFFAAMLRGIWIGVLAVLLAAAVGVLIYGIILPRLP